jgi:hypothetical protein
MNMAGYQDAALQAEKELLDSVGETDLNEDVL